MLSNNSTFKLELFKNKIRYIKIENLLYIRIMLIIKTSF